VATDNLIPPADGDERRDYLVRLIAARAPELHPTDLAIVANPQASIIGPAETANACGPMAWYVGWRSPT
jgi:hypothetical protein